MCKETSIYIYLCSAAFECFSMRRHRLYSVIHPTSKCSHKSTQKLQNKEAANTHAPHRSIFPTCSPRLLRMLDSSMPERQSAYSLIRTLSLCVHASHRYLTILHRAASSRAPAILQARFIRTEQLLKTYIRTYLIGGGRSADMSPFRSLWTSGQCVSMYVFEEKRGCEDVKERELVNACLMEEQEIGNAGGVREEQRGRGVKTGSLKSV